MKLKEFKHKAFTGKSCTINEDFEHLLVLMGDIAILNGLRIYVTSSFRVDSDVKGAIVTPAKMSNHMIGHAIDCNIIDGDKFWNSEMLLKPSAKIMKFINECKVVGLRWGGTFVKVDSVHFDDALNIKNPELWNEKAAKILEQIKK